MSASVPILPTPKAPAEPWLRQVVRIIGILILVGAVPMVLFLPIGPKVLWSMVVAAIPLGFTVAGYHAWRRVCPLAFFATLGQRLKRQRKQKVGDWLAAHGLEVQLGLLLLGMMWRHLGANGTPWALAGLLLLVVLAATLVGFLYTGKTWCNHLCPVGVVEKLYQEPMQLFSREGNSQCATCTACKKNCPDIDLEQGYWKEVDAPARRNVYYVWPGLVLAFYVYFYLADGTWVNYFSGAWSRDPRLVTKMLSPGFFFAPALPRLLAVPLTFLAFGLVSFLLFSALESLLRSRASDEAAQATVRHRCLTLAGFISFLLFYTYAGQPALLALPLWVRQGLAIGIVMVATVLLLTRWARTESDFVHEKFAKGLLKRWEWGDAPPSEKLSDLYLLHQERLQQREARLRAYKATIRDLLADGVLSRGNLLVLQKLRAELGITDKDHDKLLSELTLEEKRLFDPEYQGSREKELQLDQYRTELATLLLGEHRPEASALESLRQIHRIRPEEHARILADLRGEQGPLVAKLQTSVHAITLLLQADQQVEHWMGSFAPSAGDLRARAAFFHHVAKWRLRQHLEYLLQLLEIGLDEPRLQEFQVALDPSKPEALSEVLTLLSAMADQGPLGATLAPLNLRSMGWDDLIPTLKKLTHDDSAYVRAASLALLACCEGDAAEQSIREGLLDQEPLVRESAQHLLGLSDDLNQTLTELAGDEDQWLLRAAVQSLPAEGSPGSAPAPLSLLESLTLLHGVPLFSQLEPDDLEVIAGASTVRAFAAKDTLCRQGERSDEVFVILRGQVRTTVRDHEGHAHSVGEASEGACIGEMAVLDAAPRAATVTALQDVTTLVLSGKTFREVLYDHPAVAEGVLRVMTQRLRSLIQNAQAS